MKQDMLNYQLDNPSTEGSDFYNGKYDESNNKPVFSYDNTLPVYGEMNC